MPCFFSTRILVRGGIIIVVYYYYFFFFVIIILARQLSPIYAVYECVLQLFLYRFVCVSIILLLLYSSYWSLPRTTRMKVVVRARNQFSIITRRTECARSRAPVNGPKRRRRWRWTTRETLAAAAGHTDSYVD